MFVKISVVYLVVNILGIIHAIEDDWTLYERKFKYRHREEIFIANATEDSYFKSNFTVEKWTTLNTGSVSYSGGIMNNTMLGILFSTLSKNNSRILMRQEIYDLKENISQLQFYKVRNIEKEIIYVVVSVPSKQEIVWYSLDDFKLKKIQSWRMEGVVSTFQTFQIGNNKFLLASITKNETIQKYSVTIYGFNDRNLDRWFHQSIPLSNTSSCSCVSSTDSSFYLSIVQSASGKLLIYQFSNNHFSYFDELSSPNITQVVCFENGFKSFIALNGLSSGIYQFATDGLSKEEIVNSHSKEIQFWLPIPISIYRDETILIFQRRLDHESHQSLDIDVLTYNGREFEEHIDIPCTLFGEKQNGLKCLTEFDSNNGIIGGSNIAIADHLAIIVPKQNSNSILFNLDIRLKKIEHPIQKEIDLFMEKKKILQTLIDQQNQDFAQIQVKQEELTRNPQSSSALKARSRGGANTKLSQLSDDVIEVAQEVDALKTLANNLTKTAPFYKSIIFNGPVEVEDELRTQSISVDDDELMHILNDIVRKDNLKPILASKTISKLQLNSLIVDNVNGVSTSDLIVSNQGFIEVEGDILFDSFLEAEELKLTSSVVNNIPIENWINIEKPIKGTVHFEHLDVRNNFNVKTLNNHTLRSSSATSNYVENEDEVIIPQNLTVQIINGHDFEKFIRKICLYNVQCHLFNLTLSGVMNVRNNINPTYLNGLKFPREYVNLESEKPLIISSTKVFNNITTGYNVYTKETINNVDLTNVINLSNEQHIPGDTTFNYLDVLSDVKVNGELKGENVNKFIPNIGLKDTSNINATVQFSNLEVLGDIIITGDYNYTKFTDYIDSIVMKDENVTITGTKSFPLGFSVLKNLHVQSNYINNISLDSFIIKDTAQDLNIKVFPEMVDFDHLHLEGLFDEQNITELNDTLAKISTSQTVESKLIFNEEVQALHFVVDEDISTNDKAMNNEKNTSFSHLVVDNIIVEGNVSGDIVDFDLADIGREHLKYIEEQNISELYNIEQLTTGECIFENINGLDFQKTFSYRKFRDNITDMLMYRNASVNTLNVEQNVNISSIDHGDFAKLLQDHMWMKLHRNESTLLIDGDVYFNELHIDKLANVPFTDHMNSLVFKNESDVRTLNSIKFKNGLHVKKLIETSTLNGVALKNILRKSGHQTLLGQVDIVGDVTIADNVTVKEMINNVEVTYMLNNFDMGEEILEVKGEIFFQRMSYIRNLTIKGPINGEQFERITNKFVYIDRDIELNDEIIFSEKVFIDGNLEISEHINGLDISNLESRIIWLTKDSVIAGKVKFNDKVDCSNSLIVDNSMVTNLLFGQKFEDKIEQGVLVNRGLLKGKFHLNNITINEDLKTIFVNDIKMDSMISLKTSQHLDELNISVMTVARDIDVGNHVNGINLIVERDRTLLKNVEQYVPSEIIFLNNVVVEDNLTASTLNSKPISRIVRTENDQNLTGIYQFSSKNFAAQNLIVDGLINEINITSWEQDVIAEYSENPQYITENWTLGENLNIIGPLSGKGKINNLNLTRLVEDIQETDNYRCDIEQKFSDEFNKLCADITSIYQSTQEQIYKFQYFKEIPALQLTSPVQYVKYFQYKNKEYLLINEKNSCFSNLLELEEEEFSLVSTIHTGGVSQIELMKSDDRLLLVSRGLDDDVLVCSIRFTTTIWQFIDSDLKVISTVENQDLLQQSQVPLTFYGIKNGIVTEFKLDLNSGGLLRRYRTWNIQAEHATFIPRGFKIGLAVSTDENIFYLHRNEPILEYDEFNLNSEEIIVGNFTKKVNHAFPGRYGRDSVIINVGAGKNVKPLLAVAHQKDNEVGRRLDLVEVYSDPFSGELFDTIATYKPTCLTSMEFGNGEALLAFMENTKILQIYEYKGIEGFKHRMSIKVQANQLILMEKITQNPYHSNKVLGLVQDNKITFLKAETTGKKIKENMQCALRNSRT